MADEVIERIRARIADPALRTDVPPAGTVLDMGPMRIVTANLGDMLSGVTTETTVSAPNPTVTPAALAELEARAAVRFPDQLRRLYTDVADGGFGPHGGLLTASQAIDAFLELTSAPQGPDGQPWPRQLLPITWTDPGYDCIDTSTGAVVFWDEEALAEDDSEKGWLDSFNPEADELFTWLRPWLESPDPNVARRDAMEDAMLAGIKASLDYWRGMSPEARAEFGLSEQGWEQELFGHLGIDLDRL
ncbi:MAG: SMI1/KNR4 family protein [Acidimicrobiia bacterium]|nr:SMI1/KNR4 family protein [Acidimicrobiia bacterium]